MIPFAYPLCLLLLLCVPALLVWRKRRASAMQQVALPYSSLALLQGEGQKTGIWLWLQRHQEWGYGLVLALVVVGLARPQRTLATWPVWGAGIDIMLVLDTSSSMLQDDLRPNRMSVARKRLQQLIRFRRQRNDRLGLVLFARKAYTLCPLTVDHKMLEEMMGQVAVGVIRDDTALGDALATALARLRKAPKRQRAILLITDGENNAGSVHPLAAAALAKKMQVPIFPLLVGKGHETSSDVVPSTPSARLTPWQILQKVASTSRGSAYHAADPKGFKQALLRILDQMTPMRAQKPRYYSVREELFGLAVVPALALLGLLLLLQFTRLRSIP